MNTKLTRKRKAQSKSLCIQIRRILWQKKDQLLVKQLADLKNILLEKQNLAEHADLKELQLASSP